MPSQQSEAQGREKRRERRGWFSLVLIHTLVVDLVGCQLYIAARVIPGLVYTYRLNKNYVLGTYRLSFSRLSLSVR